MCGLAGALTSNPVDVVRTRMMNQRGAALYQGTADCLLQVSDDSRAGVSNHSLSLRDGRLQLFGRTRKENVVNYFKYFIISSEK